MDKIKELPDHSLDIQSEIVSLKGMKEDQSMQLEKLCLANFVAWFNCKRESNQVGQMLTCIEK